MLPSSTTYKSSCHKGSKALCGTGCACLEQEIIERGTDDVDCMMRTTGSMRRKTVCRQGDSVFDSKSTPTDLLIFFAFCHPYHQSPRFWEEDCGKKAKIVTAISECFRIADSSRSFNPGKRVLKRFR